NGSWARQRNGFTLDWRALSSFAQRGGNVMRLRVLIAAAIALASFSCAQAQTASDWNKVIAAAKGEGKVVFYSGLVGSPSTAAVARAFEKTYGIPAEFLDLRISEIRERMRAEQVAGRVIGDVLTTSYNVTTSIE